MEENEDYLFLVVIVTLLLVAVSFIFSVSALDGGESFSELYFTKQGLISSASAGEEQQVFFAIENHEGRKVSYSFVVYFDGGAIDRRSVSLENGEKAVLDSKVLFSSKGQKKLAVKINSPKEIDISQWIMVE